MAISPAIDVIIWPSSYTVQLEFTQQAFDKLIFIQIPTTQRGKCGFSNHKNNLIQDSHGVVISISHTSMVNTVKTRLQLLQGSLWLKFSCKDRLSTATNKSTQWSKAVQFQQRKTDKRWLLTVQNPSNKEINQQVIQAWITSLLLIASPCPSLLWTAKTSPWCSMTHHTPWEHMSSPHSHSPEKTLRPH